MAHYMALVHKDRNSAFGVQFPDVPGCFSAADTMDDLVSNATEALSLWAEDQAIGKPRSHSQLMDDKAIAAELRKGAFLISVPLIVNDTRVVSANISLERGMLKAIDEAAKQRKLTRSAFLSMAAKREISR